MPDSFAVRTTLTVGGKGYVIHSLKRLAGTFDLSHASCTLRIFLENLLRHEGQGEVTAAHVEALLGTDPNQEMPFHPARVLMQDFTGVPVLADLACMRDAVAELGGDPGEVNPVRPAELVIDHSVQVDDFGGPLSFRINAEREMGRNRERYAFLKWGRESFSNLKVAPPDAGIVHQVNIEHLARVVFTEAGPDGNIHAFPDTLVGTDSHTTMVNALGVLGWGVGGIEAEAALLGLPISLTLPRVVGVRVRGALREGMTATDLVLTLTELLRRHGVVGRFIEFTGPGLAHLALAVRATISNMTPEFGATATLFPIDAETLAYLRLTGRDPEHVALVEAYAREQGLWQDAESIEPRFEETIEVDLDAVEPALAGPRRPQDLVPLSGVADAFQRALQEELREASVPPRHGDPGDPATRPLTHGSVVIAAITSCTNTSNPDVMVAAGLLAKAAAARGMRIPWYVKTSLAPGSRVVTEYLNDAGLTASLEALGFHLTAYGCTTCIGNSGPLPEKVSAAIVKGNLAVSAVLSGNRNFEGRIHSEVKMNWLASPPLVIAYALAGRMNWNPEREPIGPDREGRPVYLRELWPSNTEIRETVERVVHTEQFADCYRSLYDGTEMWNAIPTPGGERYAWHPDSTYIRRPPFLDGMSREPAPPAPIRGARVLVMLGDSVTTDHISPAGSFTAGTPAGQWLEEQGIPFKDFNSYGARRGNHEVMMRGTFANVRLRNLLTPESLGSWTRHFPEREEMDVFQAARRYAREGTPLIVLAGKEYGTGSSRDWAAKGPALLGVRLVIAESFERIHRSNLIGMGVLPTAFAAGESAASLGLDGSESYDVEAIPPGETPKTLTVSATHSGGKRTEFQVTVRLETPREWDYWRHGGILPYVTRQFLT